MSTHIQTELNEITEAIDLIQQSNASISEKFYGLSVVFSYLKKLVESDS